MITLNKLKNDEFHLNDNLSSKYKMLSNISEDITSKNIIDRFDYLINNEYDLFTYNLDKRIFMLKFLTN